MLILKDSLLFSIVKYGTGDLLVKHAREQGAGGGTIFPAKGTASNLLLRKLGLGDKRREAVVILMKEDAAERLFESAGKDPRIEGVSALIGAEENGMSGWKLITIIVNAGYGDDIMDTARKAGAGGGTITHARGTAPNNGESRFLDITIVPEKEMVLILAPTDKTDAIVDAINSAPYLQEPGIGIIYTQDVKKFVNLGTQG